MAVSSKGMQDHLGAKTSNWVTGWLTELSTSFPIFSDPARQNPETRLRLEEVLLLCIPPVHENHLNCLTATISLQSSI